MKTQEYRLQTDAEGFYNITRQVQDAVSQSGVEDGLCLVWCPHTTAGITVNENTDPNVAADLLRSLALAYPDRPEFRHREGNSAAHLKSSAVGCEKTLIVQGGRLLLGQWQGIYFCEFDGPRSRRFYVKVWKEA